MMLHKRRGGGQEQRWMKCSIPACPGDYEERLIVHTLRHRGQVIVINHVPAEVCSVCGDVLLKPETVRRIEELVQAVGKPARTVPLYEYA
jgi:YgiT-type zinc finger domain-containing protein